MLFLLCIFGFDELVGVAGEVAEQGVRRGTGIDAQRKAVISTFLDVYGWVSVVFYNLYGRNIQTDGKPLLHTREIFVG